MAIRIQLRRDTAANWVSSNPVLRQGEIGIETDTLQMKLGNGTSTWTQITAYMNLVPDGNLTIGDYVMVNDIGASLGVVGLDSSKNALIPGSSIIVEGATDNSFETTLTVIDPTADRTITFKNADGTVAFVTDIPSTTDALTEGATNKYFSDERAQDAVANSLAAGTHTNITVTYNDAANSLSLAAAPGYVDEQAVDAVAAALAAGTHTNITVGYNDAGNAISLTGAVTYTDENAQDAIGNAVGTGLSYNDTTGAISVDTTAIQAKVANVDDTEIGYLNGVTSAIQTQIDAKLASATASTTYETISNVALKAPIASPTFTGTVTIPSGASISGFAPLASPDLTGVPTAPTAISSTNTTQVATTAYVKSVVSDLTNGAGAAYDTLKELQDLMVADDTATTALTTLVGTKAPIASPTFTGTVTLPSGTVTSTMIADSAITSAKIADGTIADADINASAAIALSKLATDPLARANHTGSQTASTISDFNEAAQDAIGTILGTGLSYNDAGNGIGINYVTLGDTLLDGVSGASYGLIGTSTYLDVKIGNGYNKEIELDIAAVKTQLNTDGYITTSSTSTLTNKTLTSPVINTPTGITKTDVGLANVDNTTDANKPVSTATQTALDLKVDESLFDAKGDLLVASADNTPAKLTVGTNGYLLTANSAATNGVEWAAAPVSLPSQTGNSGKYLTTDGSSATWGTLVVPISTGTVTVNQNTAQDVDTTALSAFTSIEYMVSIKQGSKTRTSKVILQTDGTSVDMTEFAITETGGTLAGVVVSATTASSNGKLQVTVTDALSTNATVKFSKIAL
jgi:hypothetical protein